MGKFALGEKSRSYLVGVDPDLVKIVERAIQVTVRDFRVIDGLRTVERQKELFKSGASKTMDSYHLPQKDGLGHAVDLIPTGSDPWNDKLGFLAIRRAMYQASRELKLREKLVWGADWDNDGKTAAEGDKDEHFVDSPHWQTRRPK